MSENKPSYKLIGLQADGLRKLRAISMQFADNGLIKIVGANQQGKTSILDTISILIGGKKFLKDGAMNPDVEKINLVGEITGYKIYREYREGKEPILRVVSSDGETQKGRVQDFLDSFINELTLQPLMFINLKPQEKLQKLMSLYKIDFTDIDKKITKLEEDRLFIGRDIRKIGDPVAPEEVEAVNIEELNKQRQKINDRNQVLREEWEGERNKKRQEIGIYNEIMQKRSSLISRLRATTENIAERKELLFNSEALNELHASDLKAQVQVLDKVVNHLNSFIKELPQVEPEKVLDIFALPEPDYIPAGELDEKIRLAYATNVKAKAYADYIDTLKLKQQLQIEYDQVDIQITALRNQKIEILSKVDTRINGLEIRIDGVYFQGIDTENLSDSQNMVLSLKLCSVMAPLLRAVFLDRGESLDKNTQIALDKWATENDIQVIMAEVDAIPDEKEDNCFYIIEGRLV